MANQNDNIINYIEKKIENIMDEMIGDTEGYYDLIDNQYHIVNEKDEVIMIITIDKK